MVKIIAAACDQPVADAIDDPVQGDRGQDGEDGYDPQRRADMTDQTVPTVPWHVELPHDTRDFITSSTITLHDPLELMQVKRPRLPDTSPATPAAS
jgi:hypothetical protein